MDRYEQSHVVENCINFLKKIEELKPYMVEFNKDGTIKPKAYPPDCAIKDENQQSIIIITYDKHTFSANNGIQKAQTQKRDILLLFKGKRQDIIILKFFLFFKYINLSFLSFKKRQKMIKKASFTHIKAVEIFEYKKNHDRY